MTFSEKPKLWRRMWGLVSPSTLVAKQYFQLLVAEMTLLPPSLGEDETPERQEWYKKLHALRDELDTCFALGDEVALVRIFEFELLITRLVDDYRIRAKAWSVRANYLSLVNPNLAKEYESGRPSALEADNPDIAAIRADVEDLMAGVHWWYANVSIRERAVRRIKLTLLISVVIGFFPIIGITSWALWTNLPFHCILNPLTLIFYVMYAGFLGAVTSTIRRMQPVVSDPVASNDPLLKSIVLDQGSYGVYLSALLGSIFAVILYLAWGAGLSDIGGNLAPSLTAWIDPPTCGRDHIEGLIPNTTADFSKLIIWSFIAGFSERLVPDMLDRLASNKK